METYLVWLAAGFVLVIAELVTGTFFLLVVGRRGVRRLRHGLVRPGILGGGFVRCGGGDCRRILGAAAAQGDAAADVASLDVGQAVTLDAWVNREQGAARVKYRNTLWDAEVAGEREFDRGQVLFIHAVEGSTLKVSKAKI